MDSVDPRASPALLPVHVSIDAEPVSATPDRGEEPFRSHLESRTRAFASLSWAPLDQMSGETRVLIGSRIDAETLQRAPKLAGILVPWSGIPPTLRDVLRDADREEVELLNIHHNASSAAETAIGLLLAASRGIPSLDRSLRRGDWRPRYLPRPSLGLDGGVATIIGRGAIGGRLAPVLEALGMTVRSLGRPSEGARWSSRPLANAVAGSRALVIAVPGGPDTEGIVDGTVLDAIPGGIVVNVGRGTVIDESALFDRLADGRLFAAGLDVWRLVPRDEDARENTLPSTLPFHELDNVVMTPHVGGGLGEPDIESRRADAVAEVLHAFNRRTFPHPSKTRDAERP